jgi:hypothetical protein
MFWSNVFARLVGDYVEPTLVLFSDGVRSACAFASAAVGPFYCPADQRIFIDLDFFGELARRFSAPGDFAQAYVIAHEVGHHVQNLIGTLAGADRLAPAVDANFQSVLVELQADCFAGVWAFHVDAYGLLEEGDIEEALNTAAQIGGRCYPAPGARIYRAGELQSRDLGPTGPVVHAWQRIRGPSRL